MYHLVIFSPGTYFTLFIATGAPQLIQGRDSNSNQVRKRTLALHSVQTMNQKAQIRFGDERRLEMLHLLLIMS